MVIASNATGRLELRLGVRRRRASRRSAFPQEPLAEVVQASTPTSMRSIRAAKPTMAESSAVHSVEVALRKKE